MTGPKIGGNTAHLCCDKAIEWAVIKSKLGSFKKRWCQG